MKFPIIAIAAIWVSSAGAQTAQQTKWLELQRLALESNDLLLCQMADVTNQRLSAAQADADHRLTQAIESYLAEYPGGETPAASKYRIMHTLSMSAFARSRALGLRCRNQ